MTPLPVIIDPKARDQMEAAYRWWAENRSQEQASRWLRGIERKISTLSSGAARHGLAPENDAFSIEVRQTLFGLGRHPTHRILFTIRDDSIYVFAVRHVAEDAVQSDD